MEQLEKTFAQSGRIPPALGSVHYKVFLKWIAGWGGLLMEIGRNLTSLWRYSRPTLRQAARPGAHALHLVMGQLRWTMRRFQRDRPYRLLTLQIAGGFGIALLLFGLWLSMGRPFEGSFQPDLSVPAPLPAVLRAAEEPEVTAIPPTPEALSPKNFRFEYFTQRNASGKLGLHHQAAERYLKTWFPPGTPAPPLMRFIGATLERGAGQPVAFSTRCMNLPVNKVFREATITCTYYHPLPAPLASKAENRQRVFWIVALTYDNKQNIKDFELHARLVTAAK